MGRSLQRSHDPGEIPKHGSVLYRYSIYLGRAGPKRGGAPVIVRAGGGHHISTNIPGIIS